MRVLVVFLALVATASRAMDLAELKALVARGQVTRIADLVAMLPARDRSHFALVFDSRSLHEASFENPRVILYGETGRVIVTFNGAPEQRGFEALEVAAFDEATSSFTFVEVLFPAEVGQRGPVTISEPNPEKCRACHGERPRPLWDSHPLWPGAYGERYLQPLSEPEQRGVRAFLAHQPTHPRYRSLVDAQRFASADTFAPGAQRRYDGAARPSPNEELARLLASMNARRLVALAREAPAFADHRHALLEAFGEHLAVTFARMFPKLFAASGNALDFIAGVETYVHVEVRKLYPEAELPRFDIERPRPGALAMHYRSPRAMPELAVGIIRGIGKHYAETLEIRREDLSLDATSVRLTVELVGP
jgi:hypothetical protein